MSAGVLKYMEHGGGFDSGEHEKAWLIVTAQNTCKSMLRRVYRRHVSLSEAENVMVEDKADGIMEEILKLPEKRKRLFIFTITRATRGLR